MDTRFWGPKAWKFIHAISVRMPKNAPDPLAEEYREFISSLAGVHPCRHCRQAFGELVVSLPPDTADAAQWSTMVHSKVNEKLGVKHKGPRDTARWEEKLTKKLQRTGPEPTLRALWDYLFSISLTFPALDVEDEDIQERRKKLQRFFKALVPILPLLVNESAPTLQAWRDAVKDGEVPSFKDRSELTAWLLNILNKSTDVTPPWWKRERVPPSISKYPDSAREGYIRRYFPAVATGGTVQVGKGEQALGCR